MKQILQEKVLKKIDHHRKDLYIIDAFPVIISHFKRAHFSKIFKQEATYGYCATKEMNYFGFKGHVLINNFGGIQGFTLASANIDERIAMREIIDHKIQGILLGDKGYIVLDEVDKELEDLNIDLQTPLRSNMLDLRHPYFKKKFARKRRLVETVIGQLSERFNIEQNWARDVWHLTNRMARKILSHTFSVFLCIKYGKSPLDFEGLVTV